MTNPPRISNELRQRIATVTNKRARFVLDSIAANGMVTTEQINEAGYEHPPRAVRDARELGFPIRTIKVKHSNGRSIAAYVFPEDAQYGIGKSGRKILPKKQRDGIIQAAGGKCMLCGAKDNLQVDHRIPYEIGGEPQADADVFMVLCGSCNRKKSWSCEHCSNWSTTRDARVCATCYWSDPIGYIHIATAQQRRAEIVWNQKEVREYERVRSQAIATKQTIPEFIKARLRKSYPNK